MARILTASLLTVTTLACQPDDQSTDGADIEVRDSAGIRIVENPRPAEDSRLDWRIGPEPTVSIGEADGEEPYVLYFVRDAMLLHDGRIVVANGGSEELRFYDALGNHLATRGGYGEGPGEFERLLRVEPWPGDSILAWRAPQFGLSVFDSEGNYGRTFTIADHGSTPGLRWSPGPTTPEGGILTAEVTADETAIRLQIRDGEGEVLHELGRHEGAEPNESQFARAYRRGAVMRPWGDLVVISSNYRYELKAFTTDGTLARIVRRGHELRAPTEADLLAYIEANARPGTGPGELRRRLQTVPVAEHFPAFGAVMSDLVGHLWVREYDFPGEARPAPLWTVFDEQGWMLGFVETPRGLRIYEIGEDYILGRVVDEFDVESVQLWPLARGG